MVIFKLSFFILRSLTTYDLIKWNNQTLNELYYAPLFKFAALPFFQKKVSTHKPQRQPKAIRQHKQMCKSNLSSHAFPDLQVIIKYTWKRQTAK